MHLERADSDNDLVLVIVVMFAVLALIVQSTPYGVSEGGGFLYSDHLFGARGPSPSECVSAFCRLFLSLSRMVTSPVHFVKKSEKVKASKAKYCVKKLLSIVNAFSLIENFMIIL